MELAHDAGLDWTLGLVHATAAVPHIERGHWADAQLHTDAAEVAAGRLGDVASRLWSATTRARLELARGNAADALAALGFVQDLADVAGSANPHVQPWRLIRTEALIRLGRDGEADGELTTLDTWLAGTPHVRPPLGAAPLRVLLAIRAGEPGIEARVSEALEGANGESPYEEALLRLAYGTFLLERGDDGAAVKHLEPSAALLRALASPSAKDAEQALAKVGRRPAETKRATGSDQP